MMDRLDARFTSLSNASEHARTTAQARRSNVRHRALAWSASAWLAAGSFVLAGCSLLDQAQDESTVAAAASSSAGASAAPFSFSFAGGAAQTSAPGEAATDDGAAGASSAVACDSLAGLGQCGKTTISADIRTVNILLVIDKSGSMTDQPDGFDIDKWSAVKTALGQALSGVATDVNLGLLLFPYSTTTQIPLVCHENCCDVPEGGNAINVDVDAAERSLPTILDALSGTAPGGGTPTAAALARALDYFKTGAGAGLHGNSYVLLATDGGPNCNANNSCGADRCTTNLDQQCDSGNCCKTSTEGCLDDVAVTQQIQLLKANGVRTFVVGIPGTEQYSSYLDAFAQAGGETNPVTPPSYYAVSASGGVQGLVDVFTGITTQLVHSCKLPLASDPPKLDEVNVAVDCELLSPQASDGSSWSIDTTAEPYNVVLAGPICSKLQGSGARRVDIVYGCPTVR